MKLYWMRHAEAEMGMQMDPTRELTDTGKRQAQMMGKWMKRQGIEPDLVLQSNFRRSQQTAKRIAKRFDMEAVTLGALDPEATPETAWAAIKEAAKAAGASAVVAVSHGPLVEGLLAYLTGSNLPNQYHFAHATCAYFETTTGKRGLLHWMVSPNVVARDEDEMENVTSDAAKAVEAAMQVVAIALEEAA